MKAMETLDVLFARHRQGVFCYLYRMVGQAETARDLTQEVFLRMARSEVPDAPPSALRAWVFTIARHLALNHLRDGSRRPETTALTEQSQPATQEIAIALREAIDGLPALDRDVFLMREAGGLSYDEIARACDLAPGAVRSRLHRARQQLRENLGDAFAAGRPPLGVRLKPWK
jgi:RNA polymerase sigma-70 factor (ECF subfamily)